MRFTNLLLIVLTVSVALSGCKDKETKGAEAPLVDVCVVNGSGDVGQQIFTGKTKSAEEVNLAFRVSGQIAKMYVKEGDHVSKGQVVADLDARDYQVQLLATQAEYEQIKADAERIMALYSEGNTTASNNDKARYGLQQITQKLANHKNQLGDTKLRSTIDGYVQTKLHEAGETVSAGMPVVSVFGGGNTEVEIKLSAVDYTNLAKFTGFTCKFEVTGDESFPLSLVRTSQEANSSQLYTVRFRFAGNPDMNKITPGMTTTVYAELNDEHSSGVVSIPTSALLSKDGKSSVYVLDEKKGTVHLRSVDVKEMHRDGTCEISGGLKSGEKIVCTGVHHINDGQKVRMMNKVSESNVGGLL